MSLNASSYVDFPFISPSNSQEQAETVEYGAKSNSGKIQPDLPASIADCEIQTLGGIVEETSKVDIPNAFSKLLQLKSEKSKEKEPFEAFAPDDDLALEGTIMDGFGDYMTLKYAKLQKQYVENQDGTASQDKAADKTLFAGFTAFISTSVYIEDTSKMNALRAIRTIDFKYLARLFVIHGGKVTPHIQLGQITHYVNTALPIYFLREIDKVRSKIQLVNPFWILDCVEQNKRLKCFQYRLKVNPFESSLEQSFPSAFSFSSSKILGDDSASELTELGEGPRNSVEEGIVNEGHVQKDPDQHHTAQIPISEDIPYLEQEDEEDYGMPHGMKTSAENPNFVADYFASSRLHHLATWKMKFQEELQLMLMSLYDSYNPQNVSTREKRTTTQNSLARNKSSSKKDKSGMMDMDINGDIGRNFFGYDNIEDHVQHEEGDGEQEDEGILKEPIFAHVDMDAFFASVATRNKPHLQDKPVVISHGGNRASCSSVNYAARRLGIKNGSRLGDAIDICKQNGLELNIFGYEFEEYENISRKIHEVFVKYTKKVFVKSCDEAVLDLTDIAQNPIHAKEIIEQIRKEVYDCTKCTCSGGIGPTLTLSKFALIKAKPNGSFIAPSIHSLSARYPSLNTKRLVSSFIDNIHGKLEEGDFQSIILKQFEKIQLWNLASFLPSQQQSQYSLVSQALNDRIDSDNNDQISSPIDFMSNFKISCLPGIGWKTKYKFSSNIKTIRDLQSLSLQKIQSSLGQKNGINIYLACRGFDNGRSVFSDFKHFSSRKSISVDLSYGVRFNNDQQVKKFMMDVSEELVRRCTKAKLAGKHCTLKLWIRHPDAPLKSAFLGHGHCNTFSKSKSNELWMTRPNQIGDLAFQLYKDFGFSISDVRGLGIQISNLVSWDGVMDGHDLSRLQQVSSSKKNKKNTKDILAPPSQNLTIDSMLSHSSHYVDNINRGKKRLRTIESLIEKKLSKKKHKSKEPEQEEDGQTIIHSNEMAKKEASPNFASRSLPLIRIGVEDPSVQTYPPMQDVDFQQRLESWSRIAHHSNAIINSSILSEMTSVLEMKIDPRTLPTAAAGWKDYEFKLLQFENNQDIDTFFSEWICFLSFLSSCVAEKSNLEDSQLFLRKLNRWSHQISSSENLQAIEEKKNREDRMGGYCKYLDRLKSKIQESVQSKWGSPLYLSQF